MTIETQDIRREYAADGVTTAFAYPVPFIQQIDLLVQLWDSGNVEILPRPALNGAGPFDYTVTGNAAPGGNYPEGGAIHTNTPPAGPAIAKISIDRVTPVVQPVALIDDAKLPAATINLEFDRLTMIAQEQGASIHTLGEQTLPPPNVNNAGMVPVVINDGSEYTMRQALMVNDADDSFWDGLFKPLANLPPPTVATDAATKGYVDGLIGPGGGSVPIPVLGDTGKFLKALGAGIYNWALAVVADLSDATAFMKNILTTVNNAAGLLAASGAVPPTRTVTGADGCAGGGDLSADRTITLPNIVGVAGVYTNLNATLDNKGRVTAAANGAGAAVATQAEMEAAASLLVFVTPGRQIFHPGMPKAVFWFDGAAVGTNAPLGGYGATSIQRTAAGSYTVTMPVPMSSTNYGVLCTAQGSGATHDPTGKTTTTFKVFNVNAAGAFADTSLYTVAVYGDQ